MREGYYNNAIKTIQNGLRNQQTNDGVLKFYSAMSFILQGKYETKEFHE